MGLIDADELREYMERHCEFCKRRLRIYEYLQGRCELCPMSQVYALIDPEAGLKTHDEAVQIHLEKRSDEERLSYMQGYKAGIEKGHKDMLGYYPQTRKWIPCSERVPKESGYYIVQTDGSHGHVIDIAEFCRLWSKKCEDFGWGWNKASRVIAWMPLPKPYKRGEAE